MISRRRFLERCGGCAVGVTLGAELTRWLRDAAAAAPVEVERWSRSVCDLCGLAEPVFLGTQGGRLVAVKGIPASRNGFGRLCPRARALTAAAVTEDRALQPLIRRDPGTAGTREGLEPASWEEALELVAERFRSVRDRLGPAGTAFLVSDGETCETYSRLTRLARAGLGTDHVDTPARLDALHAFDACRRAFGVPANPSSVEDVDAAELIVLFGGDVAESHPGLFYRVLDARRTGRARVLLVDSRKTLAAAAADLHLRVRPGEELRVVDALGRAADAPDDFREAAGQWESAGRVVSIVGPTLLGSPIGGPLARALARRHRRDNRWGGPGRGVLFLPRGANATAVEAFGIRPGALPAGARLENEADRDRTAAAWNVDAERLPRETGLPFPSWPAAVRAGQMGAVFVHRVNAAAELPDVGAWREALRSAFVVATTTHVPTETTVFADVVLPVALVAGESTGTMMTLDRRCQLLEEAAPPPGDARSADRIVQDVARAVLEEATFERLFADDETEWERWQAATRGTRFDAAGIPFARLRTELDVPWPCPSPEHPGTVRLETAPPEEDAPAPAPPAPLRPGGEAFLWLLTGPVREHTRSRVRTGRTAELHYEAPVARLEMHPDDGRRLSLPDGEWVTVSSDTGAATVRLWITDRVLPGTVFLPEHYGFLSDLQGGSATQKEPEGLAFLVTSGAMTEDLAPAGLQVSVEVRKARRNDMRQRGI